MFRVPGALALLAALAVTSTTALAQLTPVQEDAVVALARLYGAVRYFHPADVVQRVPWDAVLVDAADRATKVKTREEIGPMLRQAFAVVAPGVEIADQPFPKDDAKGPAPDHAVAWRHAGLGVGQMAGDLYQSWRIGRDKTPEDGLVLADVCPCSTAFALAGGWHARVRVVSSSKEALVSPVQDEALSELAKLPAWDVRSATVTRAQGLASGIALWSIARHFYPYWSDIKVDWDQALRDWVRTRPEQQSRSALRVDLSRLSALMDDGHAGVIDQHPTEKRGFLPISLRPLDGGYVVIASDAPEVAVGDVVESIGGRSVGDLAAEAMRAISAGPHARPWRARSQLVLGEVGAAVRVVLRRGSERVEAELRYRSGNEPAEKRPDAVAELRPGIHYIDLTRLTAAVFKSALPKLAKADAIVFDMRGYPSGDARPLASYWVGPTDDVKWMRVPVYARPFEEATRSRDFDWNLEPTPGMEKARKVLLIDPRAVSFSESMVGYFAAHAHGVMVGEATQGANGNVSRVPIPGGYSFRFTGMVVTTHEGKRFQAKGFQPDVRVLPTVEGIRAGRDEVLERAIEIAAGGKPGK